MLQGRVIVNCRSFSYLCYQIGCILWSPEGRDRYKTNVVLGLAIYLAYVILAEKVLRDL